MSKDDVNRYVEYEAAGIGIVENDPAEVVCFGDECEETVSVHPETLVLEDDKAVEMESEHVDTGETHIEIYCSDYCRAESYGMSEKERESEQ